VQRRWQYLAEAQRLSHRELSDGKSAVVSCIVGRNLQNSGFHGEANPTVDLVFAEFTPRSGRLQQLRDRATQNGMDLDVEHRILLPDGVIKYVHAVRMPGV